MFGIPIVSWEQWCLRNKIKDCLFDIPIVSWEQWCLDEIDEQFDIPIVFENNGVLGMIKEGSILEDHVIMFGIPIVSWEQWCLRNKIKDCLFDIPIVSWEQWCLDEIYEQFDIPIVFENNGVLGMIKEGSILGRVFGIPIVPREQWCLRMT
ncbi:hypothetical protein ACFE04_007537 [Oxalis oulophora]